MRAFVIRPFGTREGINFDDVQRRLIDPALAASEIEVSTTGAFLQAGNIRTDVFQGLLAADLVIADISVQNANVFYELGVRHALLPNGTLLIRARRRNSENGSEEVPFDLRTDRFLEYDSEMPEERIAAMTALLRQTARSDTVDSPIFQTLSLTLPDRSRLLPVPQLFQEEVLLGQLKRRRGVLSLMASEVVISGVPWVTEGLRQVGRAQFTLRALQGAKTTFEALWKLSPADIEANRLLSTIYQRLGELAASDQAIHRILSDHNATPRDRAEAMALMARNIKDRWQASWSALSGESAAERALTSPELFRAFETYRRAFHQNLDSFYPGLNAMALLTIATELAKRLPDLWESLHESDEAAASELERLTQQFDRLSGAVGTSLDAARERLRDAGGEDRWLDLSEADYAMLTSNKPRRVAFAYSNALASAKTFFQEAARSQLSLFESLGVLPVNTKSALSAFSADMSPRAEPEPRPNVILFAGAKVDLPGVAQPRFPDSIRDGVRKAIAEVVRAIRDTSEEPLLGLSSGKAGGDLLFQEVCEELGIMAQICLYGPVDQFRSREVSPAGRFWEEKFDTLMRKAQHPEVLSESGGGIPLWLPPPPGYTPARRADLWLIHMALAVEPKHLTVVMADDQLEQATSPVRETAEQHGAEIVAVSLSELLSAGTASMA